MSRPESFIDSLLTALPAHAKWIGWSPGGLLVQVTALLHPDRVNALISISMGTRLSPWSGTATVQQARFQIHDKSSCSDHILHRFIALQTIGSENARQTRRLLKKTATLPQKGGPALQESTDLSNPMKPCEVPALFITGARERVTGPGSVATDVTNLPCATMCHYAKIRGAGQAPSLSHSDAFVRVLHTVLRQTLSAPHARKNR